MRNLADERAELAADYERAHAAWRAGALERRARRGELSPEEEAELNRLGY